MWCRGQKKDPLVNPRPFESPRLKYIVASELIQLRLIEYQRAVMEAKECYRLWASSTYLREWRKQWDLLKEFYDDNRDVLWNPYDVSSLQPPTEGVGTSNPPAAEAQ
jgi:hypothetical protein